MKGPRLLLILIGSLALVLGTWEVAKAQEDGCPISVQRLANGDMKFLGCPPSPCNGTPPTCAGGLYVDGYGNSWAICFCPQWNGPLLCLLGFLPYDPNGDPTIGQVGCMPASCTRCFYDWDWIECYCLY